MLYSASLHEACIGFKRVIRNDGTRRETWDFCCVCSMPCTRKPIRTRILPSSHLDCNVKGGWNPLFVLKTSPNNSRATRRGSLPRIEFWDYALILETLVLNFQKNPGMPERRATLQMLKGLLWHKMGFGVVPSHKGKAVVLSIRRIEGEASASIGHGSERIIISLGSWETANRNPQTGGW